MSISEGVPGRRLLLIKIFAEFGYADPVQMAKDADAWVWSDQPHDDLTMGDITEGSWPVSEDKKEASPFRLAPDPLPATDFPVSLSRGRLESAVIARPVKEDAPSVDHCTLGDAVLSKMPTNADAAITTKALKDLLPDLPGDSVAAQVSKFVKDGTIARFPRESGPGYRYYRASTSTSDAKQATSKPVAEPQIKHRVQPAIQAKPDTKPVPAAPAAMTKYEEEERAQIEAFLREKGPTRDIDWGVDAPAVLYMKDCGHTVYRAKGGRGFLINDAPASTLDLWSRANAEATRRGHPKLVRPKGGKK